MIERRKRPRPKRLRDVDCLEWRSEWDPPMNKIPDEPFYTIPEIAARWKVQPITVRRAIWAGELKAKRIGRQIRIEVGALHAYEASRPAA